MEKTKIFNVIILDKSGSMDRIRGAVIEGVNSTILSAKQVQKEYDETQKHYMLLNAFDSIGSNDELSLQTIYNNVLIKEAKTIGFGDYEPRGCTPLYDAMGITLTKLYNRVKDLDDYSVNVTVITDGMENASQQYSGQDIRKLVDRLKEEGWIFTYLGANHDVEKVAYELSFDNFEEFSYSEEGIKSSWKKQATGNVGNSIIQEEIREMEMRCNKKMTKEDKRNYKLKRLKELFLQKL